MTKSRRVSPIVRVLAQHGLLPPKLQAEVQLELALESVPDDLADRIRQRARELGLMEPCAECGRRGYHLVGCSLGRPAS